MANDLISRRAVIEALMQTDALMGAPWVYENGDPIDDMDERREIIEDWISCVSSEPEIIRCKDCKWWGYDDETGNVRVCHAAKHGHISSHWEIIIRRTYRGDFYCADAERRTDE